MGIKVTRQEAEQEIGFIYDVEPKFVSLVRHGANQQPFKIIKNAKGGDSVKVIQSIITPKDVTLDQITSCEGLEYLADAEFNNKSEYSDYIKYDQLDLAKVTDLQVLKIDPGWLVVGSLKETEKSDKALVISEEQFTKLQQLPISPALADDPYMSEYELTFMNSFDREFWALRDTITGVLLQSGISGKDRKNTILKAIKAFKTFMTIALDSLGDKVIKTETMKSILNGGNDMTLFKTQEEFESAVLKIVETKNDELTAKFQELMTEEFKAVKELLEKQETPESAETPSEVETKVEEKKSETSDKDGEKADEKTKSQESSIEPLDEKIKSLEKMVSDLVSKVSIQLKSQNKPVEDTTAPVEKNVFSGLFTKPLS